MSGIISYGTYLPYNRLQRSLIADAYGGMPAGGTRSVASYDEDTTSMAVEAARAALATTPVEAKADALFFSTTRPPYLDKTNATAIHAALGLAPEVFATDMVGSIRSSVGALRSALRAAAPTLAVLADIRTGLPGGADERDGGDAAAAVLCADEGDFIAEYIGGASATEEVLDRWRLPGEFAAHKWEERFGEFAYVPLAQTTIAQALENTGIDLAGVDHLLVTGSHPRSVKKVGQKTGVEPGVLIDDLSDVVGNTGAAHPALLLASALDQAKPGAIIVLVVIADGVDVLVFRTTEHLSDRRQVVPLQQQIDATRDDLSLAKLHTWRGLYRMEPPRRPDPAAPAAPPALRNEAWKFAFVGSRCDVCGTRHLPPSDVCLECGAVNQMSPEPFNDVRATVATFTIDHLAYSESPPNVAAVIDFDGGGRLACELTDVNPDEIAVGTRVEMTFRKLFTSDGIHNYHWKARPVRGDN